MKKEPPRKVKDVMSRKVVTVTPHASFATVVQKMADNCISCVIITEHGKPIAVVSERDVVRVVKNRRDTKKLKARDVMSKTLHIIPPGTDIIAAGVLMQTKKVRRFPVVDSSGKLAGIITETDVFIALIKLIRHLDWRIVRMEISSEQFVEELTKSLRDFEKD